jgi:hypothetical protein
MRANETQQRWQRRRLEQMRSMREANLTPLESNPLDETKEVEFVDRSTEVSLTDPGASDLVEFSGAYEMTEPTEEDLYILRAMLGVDEDCEP